MIDQCHLRETYTILYNEKFQRRGVDMVNRSTGACGNSNDIFGNFHPETLGKMNPF